MFISGFKNFFLVATLLRWVICSFFYFIKEESMLKITLWAKPPQHGRNRPTIPSFHHSNPTAPPAI
jgi:hypothetical protein